MTDPFDLTDPAFVADPYPTFAAMRAQGEVHWHDGLGLWVAVSHAACDAVLRDRSLGRLWRDREPVEQYASFNLLHRTSILENEPPTHTRLRRLVAGAFSRGHVERLRPWCAQRAQELVDAARDQAQTNGSADVLAAVAEPLPVEVIAELLGVPAEGRHQLRPWTNAIVKMYEYASDPVLAAAAEQAAAEFVAYLRELVDQRRAGAVRGQDLISDLIAAADQGDRLSNDEVVGTCVLLLMAGHEATVNVLGNGLQALLAPGPEGVRPWDQLRDSAPGTAQTLSVEPVVELAVEPVVEEMLRFDSALQLFERTATAPVTIGGQRIEPGQKVAALLGAAARDPEVFEHPDRFDPFRNPNPHLAFGAGLHFCLGAPLARIEVAAVLRALLPYRDELRLAHRGARRPEFVIRGWQDVTVSFDGGPVQPVGVVSPAS